MPPCAPPPPGRKRLPARDERMVCGKQPGREAGKDRGTGHEGTGPVRAGDWYEERAGMTAGGRDEWEA